MDLAVVLHTCDNYSFLWEGWNYYFQKHWDFALPCRVYFMNEVRDTKFPNVISLPTGTGEWSDRLLEGLSRIPERNVLYMQEDFWLRRPVDAAWISNVYQVFIHHKMDAIRWHTGLKYNCEPTDLQVNGIHLQKYTLESRYIVSHQSTIWRKSFFESCLGQNESPWVNETEGTRRIREQLKKDSEAANMYYLQLTPKGSWYPGRGVCERGKYIRDGKVMYYRMRIEQAFSGFFGRWYRCFSKN